MRGKYALGIIEDMIGEIDKDDKHRVDNERKIREAENSYNESIAMGGYGYNNG